MSLSANRNSKSVFRIPSLEDDTLSCEAVSDIVDSAPFGKNSGCTIDSVAKVIAPVSLLLRMCRPFAICRKIPKIVIDSVYLKAIAKRGKHIENKVFKSMPPITDSYASAAIPNKSLICFGIATRHHALPNVVQRVFIKPMLGYLLHVKASATLRMPIIELVNSYDGGLAARTDANSNISVRVWLLANRLNGKFVKSLANVSDCFFGYVRNKSERFYEFIGFHRCIISSWG